ncbi:hypothetical protein P280DRAFT_484168 [Massarina eburnea CBS 473.64]|uniref:Uncharacterized protein n=1 Tax=Massarina eburnea CBS 473.64 TaxID=1395130 RepID=A0A6A6RLF4_9PLEO|nr:hypothetical protein P280DRAFT_484168 [Massarina eburnea CBS 473.64]
MAYIQYRRKLTSDPSSHVPRGYNTHHNTHSPPLTFQDTTPRHQNQSPTSNHRIAATPYKTQYLAAGYPHYASSSVSSLYATPRLERPVPSNHSSHANHRMQQPQPTSRHQTPTTRHESPTPGSAYPRYASPSTSSLYTTPDPEPHASRYPNYGPPTPTPTPTPSYPTPGLATRYPHYTPPSATPQYSTPPPTRHTSPSATPYTNTRINTPRHAAPGLYNEAPDTALLREGGWENYQHFMQSHGLRPHRDEDVVSAKEMLEAYRRIERDAGATSAPYSSSGDARDGYSGGGGEWYGQSGVYNGVHAMDFIVDEGSDSDDSGADAGRVDGVSTMHRASGSGARMVGAREGGYVERYNYFYLGSKEGTGSRGEVLDNDDGDDFASDDDEEEEEEEEEDSEDSEGDSDDEDDVSDSDDSDDVDGVSVVNTNDEKDKKKKEKWKWEYYIQRRR